MRALSSIYVCVFARAGVYVYVCVYVVEINRSAIRRIKKVHKRITYSGRLHV